MSKHTAGPWQKSGWISDWSQPHREDSKTSTASTVVDADGEAVAIAVVCYDGWTDKKKAAELEANARLIAAAPDLLAALQARESADQAYAKLARMESDENEHEQLLASIEEVEDAAKASARAAIAKATQ